MATFSVYLLSAAALSATPQGVVLDFSATWCGPCQQMSPIVKRLQRQNYAIRKVDVDQQPELSAKYNISSIPCFVLVVNGKEVKRYVGPMSESQLRRLAMQIPTGSAPPAGARSLGDPGPQRKSQPVDPAPIVLARDETTSMPKLPIPFLGGSKKKKFTDMPRPSGPTVARANNEDHEEPAARNANAASDPIDVAARIRVKDSDGINHGTGTVIDSRLGNTTLLTCGHVLRNIGDESVIEVDIFRSGRMQTFVGKAIGWNLKADVGLISIPTTVELASANVAPPEFRVREGQDVYSLGCGGGELPSREEHQVTRLNRYLGPDNVECTGVPVQGRSGGGLFDTAGRVVGVCIAADPREKRGLYAGLLAIHDLLDKHGLTHLYRGTNNRDNDAEIRLIADNQTANTSPFAMSKETPPFDEDISDDAGEDAGRGRFDLMVENGATLASGDADRLRAMLAKTGDAEVVCIIRPLNNPRAASEVVIINRASSTFVAQLKGEVDSQAQPTSAFVPQPLVARRVPTNQSLTAEALTARLRTVSQTQTPTARTSTPVQTAAANSQPARALPVPAVTQSPRNNAQPQRYRRTTRSRRAAQ